MGKVPVDLLGSSGTWEERVRFVVDTMREISTYEDPHRMVEAYSRRMREGAFAGRMLSLSRRGVPPPRFVLARDSDWAAQPNPWHERDKLPVLEGGLLGELAFANEVRLISDLDLPANDPSAELLKGARSLVSIPVFDGGEALNVTVFLREEPNAFDPEELPLRVWMSNLFGRSTHNLVLSDRLRRALDTIDREMRLIGEIQRSLLPSKLPRIPSLDLAAFYRPAERAGGDYYDFFRYGDHRWGILIADVSGHGSPAAVEMAITRTLAHARDTDSPGEMLQYLNLNLAPRLARLFGGFVTAFFGVYDTADRSLRFASAGHLPPRLKRCSDGSLFTLDAPGAPPLGIDASIRYEEADVRLHDGDQVVWCTDGLTEAFSRSGEMFGTDRLDATLSDCGIGAQDLIDAVVEELESFTEGRDQSDDITVLAAKVMD